jgi:plasmid replication initiation protein
MEKVVKNPNNLSNENALILKKHVGLIHCENKLSLLQRKICNILLFNALDKIGDEVYSISIRKLSTLIGYKSNDISLIKQSLKRLMSIVMEWNLLDDTKFVNEKELPAEIISWYASTLLAGASIERGIVRYSYSPQIKTVLSSLEIYGRINLFVQAKFNSSYALVLYENCVRFKNIGKTSWFSLKLFRLLMGVTSEKYEFFKELKRNVITPAIDEINKKSDISIVAEYRREGRQICAIRFLMEENEKYKPQFKRVTKTVENSNGEPQTKSAIVAILASEFLLERKQIEDIFKHNNVAYILDKINFVREQKSVIKKAAYLLSALKNDYKKSNIKTVQSLSFEATDQFLRECTEASKISGLNKKFIDYKLTIYKSWLTDHPDNKKINSEFEDNLKNNRVVYDFYLKKGYESFMVVREFVLFLEREYKKHLPKCLSLDDFITSEEVQ